MAEDQKSFKDSLLRSIVNGIGAVVEEAGSDKKESGVAKDLLVTLLSRAGKGKDEVVQILGREIGAALAAMLTKPLSELAKHQRLQVTFEFVPKRGASHDHDSSKARPKKSPRTRES